MLRRLLLLVFPCCVFAIRREHKFAFSDVSGHVSLANSNNSDPDINKKDNRKCTDEEMQALYKKFTTTKTFADEKASLRNLEFKHSSSKEVVMFLYPNPVEQSTGRFRIRRRMCKRLMAWTEQHSVQLYYLMNGPTEAIEHLKAVESAGFKLAHLVIGGHSASTQMMWKCGTEITATKGLEKCFLETSALSGEPANDGTKLFLEHVKKMAPRTVLLVGRTGEKRVNLKRSLCQMFAHKLLAPCTNGALGAGVEDVACSTIAYSSHQDHYGNLFNKSQTYTFRSAITSHPSRKRREAIFTNRHRLAPKQKVETNYWQKKRTRMPNGKVVTSDGIGVRSNKTTTAKVEKVRPNGQVELKTKWRKKLIVPASFVKDSLCVRNLNENKVAVCGPSCPMPKRSGSKPKNQSVMHHISCMILFLVISLNM